MPEEERKVSLAETAIVAGAIVFGTLIALQVLTSREAPPEVFTCPYCGAEFATEEERSAHIELEHPELLPPALANLHGVVTDADTGTPLAGVSVNLWSPDETEPLLFTQTDSSGYYELANIFPANYVIYFEKDDYETVKNDITLREGDNELNIQLTPIAPPSGEILEIIWKRCTGADVWHSASDPMPEYTDIIHRFRVRNTGNTTSFKVGYYRTDYGAGWYYSDPVNINPGEEGYIEWVFWTGEVGTYTTTWYLFGDDIEVDSMTVTTIVS